MNKKIIFVTGVSGSGKTTILNELLLTHSNVVLVPSYVTRPARPDEKNGRKYWFISQEEFDKAKAAGEFLEYAKVHGQYYYGTKLKDIEKVLHMGMIPLKEVDMEGFNTIINSGKLTAPFVSIFFDIPDELMIERIRFRAPITDEELAHRLASANKERALAKKLCTHYLDTSGELKVNMQKVNAIVKDILA